MRKSSDIFSYLPLSYKSKDEESYVSFLWESYDSNYNNTKFPFAYIAYHMLYMSYLYFEVWQIKENRKVDFEKAMIGYNKDLEKLLLEATSPFSFWEIGESNFFRFLKLIGSNNARIGAFTSSVKARNDAAHCNGRIFFNDSGIIDKKIDELLNYIDEIQTLSHPLIDECFSTFLISNWNADDREYYDDEDQIREVLIHGNYLSQKDIDRMLIFDINLLKSDTNFIEIKKLFIAFERLYTPT